MIPIKRLICRTAVFLLMLSLPFLSACREVAPEPEPEQAEPPEISEPAVSGPEPDTPPEDSPEAAEQLPPDETMAGINILTYDAGFYTIQYPNYWDQELGEAEKGYEVLIFWKKDPDVYEDGGKGGQNPNSAKISLSILPKDGRELGDIALAEIGMIEGEITSENLDIGGKKAIRYVSATEEDQIVYTYIDWNETEYVWLAGYHGMGNERGTMHRDMLYIHNSLREGGAEP
ncbi:MAG: hypothetical protein LBQ16_01015 [Gracilibacteraceae bacterium]|nr:hypothetical protein [Gracilibacteraceae bacterium]